ncbi:MAG: archaemetzincin [Raineya sp.]|jgi:archaemetzincin|nr:archaemetzincin [Raineya sp.]
MKILINSIMLLLLLACKSKEQSVNEVIWDNVQKNDQKMPTPQTGDWLSYHKEKGQTFEQYKKSKYVQPTKNRNIIYVLPIGNFDAKQNELIQYTAEYLEIFFNLKVKCYKPVSDSIIPSNAKRISTFDVEQLWASYILNPFLKKRLPEDAIAFIAITEKDLYPEPSWNFVFGLATDNLGVMSIFRLLENENYTLCLERLIKVISHEMGHMFSVSHCINAVCVMNGSNTMEETDKQPNRLCSDCLKKLSWNLKFNDRKRLERLLKFMEKHQLKKDYELISKDL